MFSQIGDASVKYVTSKFFSRACPCPPHSCPTGQSGVGVHVSVTHYGLFQALRAEQGTAECSAPGNSGKSHHLSDNVSFRSDKAWV